MKFTGLSNFLRCLFYRIFLNSQTSQTIYKSMNASETPSQHFFMNSKSQPLDNMNADEHWLQALYTQSVCNMF